MEDNEAARINALIATGMLDTDAEERFDRLTRLARAALNAEIALISLVDQNRQWFKSRVGLAACETPREVSFCTHAIRNKGEVMVVLDAAADSRFRDNPLVTGDPNISFYAGAPLVTSDGHAIGTLCIIDSTARERFDAEDQAVLQDMARTVMTEVEAAQARRTASDLSVINAELHHRMGNMYAHISSIISLLGRSEEDKERLIYRLLDTIRSMSQVQAALAAQHYKSVSFVELVDATLSPFALSTDENRVRLVAGADFQISEQGAFALTLALHELATNALKYGALASNNGTIALGITIENERSVIEWREFGAALPARSAMPSSGFGSQLLTHIVPRALGGSAGISMEGDGLLYRLDAETSRVAAR